MARKSPAASAARRAYQKAKQDTAPGEGSRFKALTNVAEADGADNPAAVAAAIGRKKFGASKFAAMSAAGRKRKK